MARATGVVAAISLAALALSTLVAVRLARAILGPVRQLTRSVEAIRRADFSQRVPVESVAEFGQLAAEFNRMAETLAEYRASSLGELLLAKATLEATLAALPDVLRAVGEALSGGRPANGRGDLSQALSLPLAGRVVKLLLRVAPIPDFLPRRPGAVLVLDDVTEFARLDELRGELVAVASHELKTPLTSLQMNLLLLAERAGSLTPQQREILDAAVHGSEELRATIEELLDLTRIEAGQLRLLRERVDLAAVVRQAVRALRPRFDDAGVVLRVEVAAPGAAVCGDGARLRVVFVNLLGNALKYTPRGGEVVVRLEESPASAGGKARLQVSVTDTGPGIPAEFRERVFEKFFRVEDQGTGAPAGVRGAGIGLYLCRQIAEAHGGTLRCEPGDGGRGTRMVLQLEVA
jgi:NtrC-family two-component system sensor histidine kinase KinB